MAEHMPPWVEKVIGIHTAVTNAVTHASRLKDDRYFVWDVDGFNDLIADGKHCERIIHGTTDLFTKREFDFWFHKFEESLNGTPGVAWSFDSSEYEEDTGFWHHIWNWSVTDDGEM